MLLDQMLPCINGFEFLATIRASWQAAHIPELKLTASALTSDKESILNYGFDGFFPKPICQGSASRIRLSWFGGRQAASI